MEIRGENQGMLLQAKEYQGLPQITRRKERDMEQIFLYSLRKEPILLTPRFQTFSFQNDKAINKFVLCKSLSLGYCVTAALVNSYREICSSSPLFHLASQNAAKRADPL